MTIRYFGNGEPITCEWKGHEGRAATRMLGGLYLDLCDDEHISSPDSKLPIHVEKANDGPYLMVEPRVELGSN